MFTFFKEYYQSLTIGNTSTAEKKPEIIEDFHFVIGPVDHQRFDSAKDYLKLLADVYTEYRLGNTRIQYEFENSMTAALNSPKNIWIVCNILFQHLKLESKHHSAFSFSKQFADTVRQAIVKNKTQLTTTMLGGATKENVYKEIIRLNYILNETCGFGLFN